MRPLDLFHSLPARIEAEMQSSNFDYALFKTRVKMATTKAVQALREAGIEVWACENSGRVPGQPWEGLAQVMSGEIVMGVLCRTILHCAGSREEVEEWKALVRKGKVRSDLANEAG